MQCEALAIFASTLAFLEKKITSVHWNRINPRPLNFNVKLVALSDKDQTMVR